MAQREYIDFGLHLEPPGHPHSVCRVSLLPTPEIGETLEPVDIPRQDSPPADLLPLLAAKAITWSDLVRIGKKLANILLPEGPIRELFLQAYRQAGPQGGVRLRIIATLNDLKQLPWEFAFLPLYPGPESERGFIALDPRISLVRHESLNAPHPKVEPSEDVSDVRMLIAAASPKSLKPLQLTKEVARLLLEQLADRLSAGKTRVGTKQSGGGPTVTAEQQISDVVVEGTGTDVSQSVDLVNAEPVDFDHLSTSLPDVTIEADGISDVFLGVTTKGKIGGPSLSDFSGKKLKVNKLPRSSKIRDL
jgi:hypothetical protein